MEKKLKLFPKRSREHGLSGLLRARKRKIFQTKKRFDRNRDLIDRHKEISRLHHLNHYGREKLKWEWGTIDHLGVWATGSGNKNETPTFMRIGVECPKQLSEKVSGWYCYVGPIPEFEDITDEIK